MTAPRLMGTSAPKYLAYSPPSSILGFTPHPHTIIINLRVFGNIQYTMDYNYVCVCIFHWDLIDKVLQ